MDPSTGIPQEPQVPTLLPERRFEALENGMERLHQMVQTLTEASQQQGAAREQEINVLGERLNESLQAQLATLLQREGFAGLSGASQPTPSVSIPTDTNVSMDDTDGLPLALYQGLDGLSLEKPPRYHGVRENDAARVWLIHIDRWLDAKQVMRKKSLREAEKVVLAASFLDKEASAWWNLTYHQTKENPALQTDVDTWDKWKTLFLHQFGDVRTQDQRRDEFDALRQGLKNTETVQAFRQAIDKARLYLDPRPSDEECLLVFKRGLKEAVRSCIEYLPDHLVPNKYTEYVLFADKCEREMKATANRTKFIQNRFGHGRRSFPARRNANPTKDSDNDVEMTLNSMQSRPVKDRGQASKAGSSQRDRQRNEDRCFNCNEGGRIRKDCPQPMKKPIRRGFRGRGKRRST
jgi:hypothetical protein